MNIKKAVSYIEDLSESFIQERCASSNEAGESRNEQYKVVEFISGLESQLSTANKLIKDLEDALYARKAWMMLGGLFWMIRANFPTTLKSQPPRPLQLITSTPSPASIPATGPGSASETTRGR